MMVEVILRLTNLAIRLGCQTVVGQGMAKLVKGIFRNLKVEFHDVNIILLNLLTPCSLQGLSLFQSILPRILPNVVMTLLVKLQGNSQSFNNL